jgi:hypothetical protein
MDKLSYMHDKKRYRLQVTGCRGLAPDPVTCNLQPATANCQLVTYYFTTS